MTVRYSPFSNILGIEGTAVPATRNANLGAWTSIVNGTILGVGDVVQYNGTSYYVKVGHAKTTTPVPSLSSNFEVYAAQGEKGDDGIVGLNSAIIYIYQRKAGAAPARPTNQTKFNFTTGILVTAPNNSWTQTIPAGTDPIWVTLASASSIAVEDFIEASEWTPPQILAQNGVSGINAATIYLYQRKATAPVKPSQDTTYTFATKDLTNITNNWLRTIPANNSMPLWVTTATAASADASDIIYASEWAPPEIMAENGASGSNMIPSPVLLDKAEFGNGATLNTTTVVNGRPIVYKRAVLPATTDAYVVFESGTQVISVIPGETLYFAYTASLDINAANRPTTDRLQGVLQFCAIDGTVISDYADPMGIVNGSAVALGSGNLTTQFGKGIVPANAAYVRFYVHRIDVAQAGYFLVAEPFLGRSEQGSTFGADWDGNLDGVPDNLQGLNGTEGIENTLITIGANGALTGAGTGQVTIAGLTSATFKADADAAILMRNDVADNNRFSTTEKRRYINLVNGWTVTVPDNITKMRSFNNATLNTAATRLENAWLLPGGPTAGGDTAQGFLNYLQLNNYTDLSSGDTINRDRFNRKSNEFTSALTAAANELDAYAASTAGWGNLTGTVPSNVNNLSITLGNNGTLSGAGVGQVTIGGLGFTGALNATYGAQVGTNTYSPAGTLLNAVDLQNDQLSMIEDNDSGFSRLRLNRGGTAYGGVRTNLQFGATLGAQWGSNITSRPTNLANLNGNEGINNGLITLGNNGTLSGAGVGQVTIGGLGFLGNLRATRNQDGANMIPSPIAFDQAGIYSGAYLSDNTGAGTGRPLLYGKRIVLEPQWAHIFPEEGITAMPVNAGERIYGSYAATHVSVGQTNDYYVEAVFQWFGANGTYIGADVIPNTKAGGYDIVAVGPPYVVVRRGSVVAPAGAAFTRMYVQRITAGGGYFLVSEFYIGRSEQGANRVANVRETDGYHYLQVPGSGHRVGDSRNLPAVLAAGLAYRFTGTLTASSTWRSDLGYAITTVTVSAGYIIVGSNSVYYNSISWQMGGTGSDTRYFFVDDPSFQGGSPTLQASGDRNAPYQYDGRIFFGGLTLTHASAGNTNPPPETGDGGSGNCVSAEAWVQTKNGLMQAKSVKAGDELLVLTTDHLDTEWIECTSSFTAPENVVRLTTQSGYEIDCSQTTPIVFKTEDGFDAILAGGCDGKIIPILKDNRVAWEKVSVEFIGMGAVQHISCHCRVYAAGNNPDKLVFTHNIVNGTVKP